MIHIKTNCGSTKLEVVGQTVEIVADTVIIADKILASCTNDKELIATGFLIALLQKLTVNEFNNAIEMASEYITKGDK